MDGAPSFWSGKSLFPCCHGKEASCIICFCSFYKPRYSPMASVSYASTNPLAFKTAAISC